MQKLKVDFRLNPKPYFDTIYKTRLNELKVRIHELERTSAHPIIFAHEAAKLYQEFITITLADIGDTDKLHPRYTGYLEHDHILTIIDSKLLWQVYREVSEQSGLLSL